MTRLTLITLMATLNAASAQTPTPAEAANGWIALFDGESPHGWTGATVNGNELVIAPGKIAEYALPFPDCELRGFGFRGDLRLVLSAGTGKTHLASGPDFTGSMKLAGGTLSANSDSQFGSSMSSAAPATGPIRVSLVNRGNAPASLKNLWLKPTGTTPIFDGKDLDDWKAFATDPKRAKSKFTVTDDGELRVQDGPGDLQTVKKYGDFLLQLQCKTNGDALNSGVFFRCVGGEYQQGYEVQIQNGVNDGDPTKPADFGTGAIYRRQPARKVVSHDKQYFTLTLIAAGPNFATWVDGVPVMHWQDDREPNDNPRKGLRTAPGHLSIQGHDKTTDILFKDVRIVRLK